MEVDTAVRARLLAIAGLVDIVDDRVWKHRLEFPLDGSGLSAVVVTLGSGWATPTSRNTQEYPLVRLDLWADQSRDPAGNIEVYDGVTKAQRLYRLIDPVIHGIRGEWWGGDPGDGLQVIGCDRWGEPVEIPTQYEASCLSVSYAMQVIH